MYCTSRSCGENNLIDEHEGDETHEKRGRTLELGKRKGLTRWKKHWASSEIEKGTSEANQ
jgi:hypothetical protein